MVEKFGFPVSASIKESGASKKEKELTPDELLEKEAEKISMDMNREGMKGEIERLKKKIAEINEAEKKNSGVKITDKRGGAEVVNNGKNEEVAHIEKDIRALENDLKNIDNKKRAKDLREEIRRLEVEAGKKYAGEGYIDKTEASFDQQIAEKEAELKKIENIISGNKELPKEKTEEIELKTEESRKAEEAGKRTMEEVEKERAEKAQKDIDGRFPKKESTVETVYPTPEARQAKIDSEKSDYEKAVEEIDAEQIEEADTEKEIGRGEPQDFEGISKEQDEKIMRLGKQMEDARKFYINKDHSMDKHATVFRKIFGIGKRGMGNVAVEFEQAKQKYEEAAKAYKDALMEITTDREELEMMGDWINRVEQTQLQSTREDVKAEQAGLSTKILGKYIGMVEGYRKMDWKKKLLIGGAFMGAGLATGAAGGALAVAGGLAFWASRALGISSAAVGFKAGFEAKSKSNKDKEAVAMTNEDISWSMEQGEINFEEYKNRLDSKIQNVDKELQSRKQWDKWRNWMAAGAGVGLSFAFKYLGKETSEWVSEKFGWGGVTGVMEKPEAGGAGAEPDEADILLDREVPNENPVETPIETPVTEAPIAEAPAETPTDVPMETPIEKPVPEPWSQEVVEQRGNPLPVHEFTRGEITEALHDRFNMFSGTYDNLSSSKIGEFLNMRPGMMYTTGTPWEGYDYNEFSGFQKSLHEFYDGLSPEQQAEASNLSVDEFVKKHGVDYFGSGDVDVAQTPVENIQESIAGAGAEIGAGEQVVPNDMRVAKIIGFTENEYDQIKKVKVGQLLKTMPIGDNPRGLSGLNLRGTAFDLPQDGFPGPLEMARQLDLANYINEFHPSGAMNSMTVEEFLQKNPPGKNIFKILMLDPGDYQEIQGKSVNELLKEVPTSKDASFFQRQSMAEKIQVADYIRGHKLTPEMRSMSIKEFLEGGSEQAGAAELPDGWQGKPIEGVPVETRPGAELPEQKAPVSGPRVEENFNPDTEKEMRGGRPYNADELIKETDKIETVPKEQSGAAKTPTQMYDEAMKNREGAAGNTEANETPHEKPVPNAEKGFPYPKETIAQGNEYLKRGYTEESLRKIAGAGGLDGRPGAGGRVLEVMDKNGKTRTVPINYESKMAANYALETKEGYAKAAQEISGGDRNKWNAIKDQPVEQVLQSNELTPEEKSRLLKYEKIKGAFGRSVKGVIKNALKRGLGGGYY